MLVAIPVVRRQRRFILDEAGAAQLEWIVAVALVVMTAIPVIALIGKGSENYTGDIAISITETSASATRESGQRTIVAGLDVGDDLLDIDDDLDDPRVDTAPGTELGIGYAAGSESRFGGYRLVRDTEKLRRPETAFHGANLSEIRRDKPAEDTVRRADDIANIEPGPATVAPDRAGISLPRLPESDIGFTDAACREMLPVDEDTISQAKFVTAEVVTSGR